MKISTLTNRGIIAVLFTLFTFATVFAQSDKTRSDVAKAFRKFDIVKLDSDAGARPGDSKKRIDVRAAGRVFQLEVERYDVRSSRYRTEDTGPAGTTVPGSAGINTFKGKIPGVVRSEVRLTINGSEIEGFFEADGERFFIEPAKKYSADAAAGEAVIYKAEDSLNTSPFFCETDIPTQIERGAAVAQAGTIEAAPYRVIELATDADYEYVQALGGAAQANSEILGIMNMVEGTYNAELGLSIRVVFQHTWTTPDPFAGDTTNVILNAFKNHWNTAYPVSSVPRDAAHLFTAKAAASSRGLAFVGVICSNPSYAYGLSGYISWAPGKYLIPAHEIGHNLGGNHAEAEQNCANTIMNATVSPTTPLTFCAYSRNEITTYVNNYGYCLTAAQTPAARTLFDFDGDGKSDQAVFRPALGAWYINGSSSGFISFQFGTSADKAVSADFDGDGRSDAAVYRAGSWYRMRSATNTVDGASFGLSTDIPVPADFDGDAKAEIAVFRPSDGNWYILSSINGAYSTVHFGSSTDVPVPADYDGDGKADFNVFRSNTGAWYRLNSSNGAFVAAQFGQPGDKAIIGDFDGDGKADLAVYRPANGGWYTLGSMTGAFSGAVFGLSTDIPAAGDFDGDGKTDISVFRPSDGTWYRLNSSNGGFAAVRFGQQGDQPIEGFYIR